MSKAKFRDAKEAISALLDVALYMQWEVAIPNMEGDDLIPGVVVGKREYIDAVLHGRDDHLGFQKGQRH